MHPVAVLDFGTNTFNLLIASKSGDSFKVLYNGKQAVRLGHGGINKRIITKEAMERGVHAISQHMEIIQKYGASEIHAFATSAFRNATNGVGFSTLIREKFGFPTQIIDGDEEAQLIYEGIRASVSLNNENSLILDIGGGSNEFIICNKQGILWKHSFELGMARIIEKFNISDPISKPEIIELETYFDDQLQLLTEQVHKYAPSGLIGASGSFDTIAAMVKDKYGTAAGESSSIEIEHHHYKEFHHRLLNSTAKERMEMPGMEPVRVEMIVPATIFINFVIHKYGLNSFIQSNYALKEGVMSRIIRNK